MNEVLVSFIPMNSGLHSEKNIDLHKISVITK
jgi:hypothetical protein